MDPATETLVTVGASEALTCAFLGLVNRGDEVILFDPQVQPRMPAWVPIDRLCIIISTVHKVKQYIFISKRCGKRCSKGLVVHIRFSKPSFTYNDVQTGVPCATLISDTFCKRFTCL